MKARTARRIILTIGLLGVAGLPFVFYYVEQQIAKADTNSAVVPAWIPFVILLGVFGGIYFLYQVFTGNIRPKWISSWTDKDDES